MKPNQTEMHGKAQARTGSWRPTSSQQLNRLVSITFLAIGLVWIGQTCAAQDQGLRVKPRPRIGLALSGGAALGLSHIGVLEWFERHHIPIDCLAGTSMGGLIGGCYCTGMSVTEIHSLVKSIDWNDILRAGPEFQSLSSRRKEDERQIASTLTLGLRHGVSLPQGLSPGNSVGLLLSRISLPYSDVPDFDALPTPFRCVAVDLEKAEAITLRDGSLATALRATMALPAIFTPVERDGRLLVDGGILNNIPTEAVKEMGADVVIAVDLSADFLNQKEPGTLLDVASRAIDVRTYANERRSLKLADIILSPDLAQLNGTQFARVDEFAARGYRAAEDKAGILERFALGEPEWAEYEAERNARRRSGSESPTFVRLEGVDKRSAKTLEVRLRPFTNTPLNTTQLERMLTRITGEGRFESFQYGQIRNAAGPGLLLSARSKSLGTTILRFGLEVDGSDTDIVRTDFSARLISLDAGAPGAEVRSDLRLGSNRYAAFEYYRPLDAGGRWFVAPRAFYSDESINLFSQGARVAIYGNQSEGAGLDLGYNTGRKSELRLGYQFQHERASVRIGSPVFQSPSGDVSAARIAWTYNGQDSPMVPTRGTRIRTSASWYLDAPGASGSYPAAEASLSSFHPVSKNDSLFNLLSVGTTFGNRTGPLQQFTAGGPLRLGAYGQQEFRGNDYIYCSLGYLHCLLQLPSFLGGRVMAGSWYEFGGAMQSFGHARYLSDLSIGLVAETVLGPMVVGYSYGEAGRNRFYFALGRLF